MDVAERFLKYVSYWTTSDENSTTVPSTERQLELGRYLEKELKDIGLKGVKLDKYGIVYGYLPASKGVEAPSIGFIAHMDTSPDVSGKDVRPRRIKYKGGDIKLSNKVTTSVKDFEFLENYKGQELIVTDGSTLLGADNKAGIAEIVTALEYLIAHPEIKHGKICVGFTPDEEIGRGTDNFNIKGFGADFAYTVDGGALGEIEYENFNAAEVRIAVNGVNIHPGSAKNKMKNAVLIASELISMLPPAETPAHTEAYEGFYHVCSAGGNETRVEMKLLIRDHDTDNFKARKAFMENLVKYLNDKYGAGSVELAIKDSYYNMKEKILPVMHIVKRAEQAMRDAGIEPKIVPIRGGTDGVRLSYKGLPCPNLSTGGENFHGIHEFVSVPAMKRMVEVIVNIVKLRS